MPKTNYSYAKRQREIAKKQKKEEKRRRKAELTDESEADVENQSSEHDKPAPGPDVAN